MSKVTSSERRNSEEQLLVGELTHRMNNEFAAAIAVVSLAAARSPNGEVKRALAAVEARLHSYVQVNRYLQMPSQDTIIDASAHLRQLCQPISRSRLDCSGIELQFVGCRLEMNSVRCWRLGMVISELVTNAARHAFVDGGGKIQVELSRCGPFINCRVADDGAAPGIAAVPAQRSRLRHRKNPIYGGLYSRTSRSRLGVDDSIAIALVSRRMLAVQESPMVSSGVRVGSATSSPPPNRSLCFQQLTGRLDRMTGVYTRCHMFEEKREAVMAIEAAVPREPRLAWMLQIHIYLPPGRPISVLKISSHPPPLCGSLGFENVQDDMARPFLFGWPGASDCDQGCCAASFFGRRARAGSKQGRAGICTERIGKIRQARAAQSSWGN